MSKTAVRALTRKEIDFYNENGYLVVEELFSSEECDKILSVCEQYADAEFHNIINLDRQDQRLRDVIRDPRIVNIVETLQGGRENVALMSQILFKRVGTPYASQAWNPHQDNSYPQAKKGTYMQINLSLAASDEENGGLYFYPGSHNEDILPFEPTISYREKPGSQPGNKITNIPSKYKKVAVSAGKGAGVFLHSHVIHGSYPNVSKTRSRPVFSIAYIVKGETFIEGKNGQRTPIPLH